jgi:hypothetical protein
MKQTYFLEIFQPAQAGFACIAAISIALLLQSPCCFNRPASIALLQSPCC